MMRFTRQVIVLFVGLMILAMLPLLSVAQDATPFATATPISITGDEESDSAAPSLGVVPPAATESVDGATTDTTTDSTTDTGGGQVSVPSAPVCPTLIQQSFTATEFVCEGVSTGEACIGNGTVESVFGAENTGASFAAGGDTISLTSLEEFRLLSTSTPDGAWTVVNARVELESTDGDIPVGVPFLLYGDVTVTDTGAASSGGGRNATVIAGRGLNVRRTPGNDGVLIWQLGAGEQVIATGITSDRQWIRLQIPNRFSGTGWAYAPYLEVNGGSEALPVVTASSPPLDLSPPEFGPMQSIELLTANSSPDCDALDSGIILQSPNGLPDRVKMRINGVEIRLNGTAHIQAQADGMLTVNVLEGSAQVAANGETPTVEAGSQATVRLDSNLQATGTPQVASIELANFFDLPTRLLPRQISLGEPPVQAEAEAEAQPTEAIGFGTPPPTNTSETCTLTNGSEERNMRSGPDTSFDILRVLNPNESITGIGQVNVQGFTWYQTSENGWVRFDTVSASAACGQLPIVEAPTPTPPEPTAPPEPAAVAGLSSSLLGDVDCPNGSVTASGTSNGSQLFVSLGGTWTVQAGTSVTFTVQGGQFRPEFGDYIQLVGDDGAVLAGSEQGTQIEVLFSETRNFVARFSAANGDTVIMQAVCNGTG